MRTLKNILVTGGSGFIGSNFIRSLLNSSPDFSGRIINLDALTYAGNPENLTEIAQKFGGERYIFMHGSICDAALVEKLFQDYGIDTVVHFAAESHVDRSILTPDIFLKTNILGTYTLLEAARKYWGSNNQNCLFHHVSTDEVFGALGATGAFTEDTAYNPRSPYSASKASSDHLVRAYYHTYGLPITISNCSNNYGPYQFPEKFIPLMILNILESKELPVYGDGKQVRDWVHVYDHNKAVWTILSKGMTGETYTIGGENEWENIQLLYRLIDIVCTKMKLNKDTILHNIRHITDRPGHDRRYAIDCTKLKKTLGWKRTLSFDQGLEQTVDWYIEHNNWIQAVRSGEYRTWIDKNYANR